MANKIISIAKKNFQLFARSRSSSLVIFLGPLLIVLLVGAAFTNTQFLVNVGAYSDKYTNLTESILSKLDASQFKVMKEKSEQACITSVKSGSTQVCIIFPKDLEIKEDRTNQIIFYVDFSRINLVYMVLDIITGRVGERTKEISTSLTEDILQRMALASGTLIKDKASIADVRTDIQDTSDKAKTQVDTLTTINLGVDRNSFKLDDIAAKISSTKGALNDAISVIDGVKSDVTDSNLTSSEKDDLQAALTDAKTRLQDALNGIQGTNGSAVVNLVDSARAALDELDTRLSNAAAKRNEIANQLTKSRELLQKDISTIDSVLDDVNGLIKSLSNPQIGNATQIVTPITTVIKPVAVERSFFSLAFPTLLVLFIMVTAILLSSTMVIVEKKSVAFFRNAITPTLDVVFSLATYLTAFITMFVQVLIFIMIASLVFKISLFSMLPVTLIILFIVITFFVFIGMIIGSIFRTEETGTLAAITASSMFLFFSNVVLPLETLPAVIRQITNYNPFVISELMLKQSLLFQFGFKSVGSDLLTMTVYVLVLFGLFIGVQKLSKSHFIFHRQKIKK